MKNQTIATLPSYLIIQNALQIVYLQHVYASTHVKTWLSLVEKSLARLQEALSVLKAATVEKEWSVEMDSVFPRSSAHASTWEYSSP